MTRPARRNLGLDLVRVTEAAAIAAGRWMGLGQRDQADREASGAMHHTLNELDIDGRIVIGEETKPEVDTPLDSGHHVGTGNGLDLDVVVDPIEGLNLLAQGLPGSIAVAGMAPRGTPQRLCARLCPTGCCRRWRAPGKQPVVPAVRTTSSRSASACKGITTRTACFPGAGGIM